MERHRPPVLDAHGQAGHTDLGQPLTDPDAPSPLAGRHTVSWTGTQPPDKERSVYEIISVQRQTLTIQALFAKAGETMLVSSNDDDHSGFEQIPGTVTSVRTDYTEDGGAAVALSTGDTLTYDNYERVMVFRPFYDLMEK